MSTAEQRMLIACDATCVCVQIIGPANFNRSIHFKSAVLRALESGRCHVRLDLAECPTMDSTFLGVLAGLTRRLATSAAQGEMPIELLNPTPRVISLLDNLGVMHLFKLGRGANSMESALKLIEPEQAGHDDLARNSLEAHEILTEVCPDNVERFKDVIHYLRESLNASKPAGE